MQAHMRGPALAATSPSASPGAHRTVATGAGESRPVKNRSVQTSWLQRIPPIPVLVLLVATIGFIGFFTAGHQTSTSELCTKYDALKVTWTKVGVFDVSTPLAELIDAAGDYPDKSVRGDAGRLADVGDSFDPKEADERSSHIAKVCGR